MKKQSSFIIPLGISALVFSFFMGGKILRETPSVLGTSVTSVKEHFVPIGTGNNTATDWTDVGGAKVTIDTGNYGSIKKAYFEAAVYCLTGNQTVWVRLYNVTDGHPVWYTELSADGVGPTLVTSPTVTLGTGSKTYQVQMKSQLGYPAELKFARLHITTQ